jgi:hypothetical protein
MTTTKSIAEGDRIYATETIGYLEIIDPKLNDGVIERGDEGTVIELIRDSICDLLVEWDAGFIGAVDSGSVALVPGRCELTHDGWICQDIHDGEHSPLGSPDNPCDCGNGELLMPCEHWQAIGRTA